MSDKENAIAWLIQAIGEQANGYENNKCDMETRLMKISSYVYAINAVRNMNN